MMSHAINQENTSNAMSSFGPVCTLVLGANVRDSVPSEHTAFTLNSSYLTDPSEMCMVYESLFVSSRKTYSQEASFLYTL